MDPVRILLSIIVSSLTVGGCMSEAAKQRLDEKELIEKSRFAVGARLLDPTSPIFTQVTARNGEVCGLVRGKNTFGGYVAQPTRFVFNEATQATLEPDPSEFSLLRKEVREGPLCMFDIEYRECKGEENLPAALSCMAWLHDDDVYVAETPTVSKELATSKCLAALDASFKRDIRPGTLRSRSVRASKSEIGAWSVRIEWTADGANFSGIESAGTCVVNANGLTRVVALNAD